MVRLVRDIKWAKQLEKAPFPKSRPKDAAKAAGLRYERLVAKALHRATHNPWFQFEDINGISVCSPDLLYDSGDKILIIECKLTATQDAWAQLGGLYIPVVEKVFGRAVVPVSIAKNLTPNSRIIVDTLASAIERATERPTLHWTGRGPFPWR